VDTAQNVSPNTTDSQSFGSLLPNGRGKAASDRVRKSERLDKIIVGKTANREEAIKQDLKIGIVPETEEICESPEQVPNDAEKASLSAFPSAMNCVHLPAPSAKGKDIDVIPEIHLNNYSQGPSRGRDSLSSFANVVSSPGEQIQQTHRSFGPPINFAGADAVHGADSMQQNLSRLHRKSTEKKVIETRGKDEVFEREGGRSTSSEHQFQTPITPPQVSVNPAGKRIIERSGPPAQGYSQQPNINPIQTLPPSPRMSQETVPEHDIGRRPQIQIQPSPSASAMPLSPYAIYQEKATLERLWDNMKGTFSAFRKIPEDRWLKKFISNRDIVG
jgi:hypothetical protein